MKLNIRSSHQKIVNLNEIEVRSQYPLPSTLKELEMVVAEEWYKIPLETLQALYKSISHRIQSVIEARFINKFI